MIKIRCNMIFCHMTPLALESASHDANSMVNGTITNSCPDDWNVVQHEIFGHVIPLMPASLPNDYSGIINGTTACLMPRWSKWGTTVHSWSCGVISTGIGIKGCWWFHQWHHCIPRLRHSHWGATWLFWLCDTIGTSITWYTVNSTWYSCQYQH